MDHVSNHDQHLEITKWIREAKNGSREAMDNLLDNCRGYLLGIANNELDSAVAGKVGASDIVQETLVDVQEGIQRFRGENQVELHAWLRQIVKHNIGDVRRKYLVSEKRDVSRELSIDQSNAIHVGEPVTNETPSRLVHQQDQELALLEAMERLSADYRDVIRFRNWELLSFGEIGQRMNRSEDAARKLWARAIQHLQQELTNDHGL